jgi:hypothetical protein
MSVLNLGSPGPVVDDHKHAIPPSPEYECQIFDRGFLAFFQSGVSIALL